MIALLSRRLAMFLPDQATLAPSNINIHQNLNATLLTSSHQRQPTAAFPSAIFSTDMQSVLKRTIKSETQNVAESDVMLT
jgi:hypothetical protein